MRDPRITPANDRVALVSLMGQVQSQNFVEGDLMQCASPSADILGKPDGERTSQLLFGDAFLVLEQRSGYAFGQTQHDGYCGYVRADVLAPREQPTHWVCAPSTHRYIEPDIKQLELDVLYFGSKVAVVEQGEKWVQLSGGQYVHAGHLLPLKTRLPDPVDVAELFLGTPYLWGGGTGYGIDCSGLIQIAWRGCGKDCPRDSDLQEAQIGTQVELGEVLRGDLVFWKGHVGIMSSPTMLLHANAHHMSVACEPLADAKKRISKAGDGPVTSMRRP